jgi:hypothetical protein
VNVDNFVRAETERMLSSTQAEAGGVNRLGHNRAPTSVEHQPVIRLNRDTLYSFATVDISEGATITIPEYGERYVSVMVVNQDHYVNGIFHEPGRHSLTVEQFDTPWVCVAARILVDPTDRDDVAAVNELQDQFAIDARSAKPLAETGYETDSLDETRKLLLGLARGLTAFDHSFGAKSDVDPVRHLIATAAGWGGLPDGEATYIAVEPRLPIGGYELTVRDVPVDGFWSISVYNADGYFEPNDRDAYSVNNITATPNDDGSVTVHFGGSEDLPNMIPIMEGWNYLVRLYRPRAEILDGSWTFPSISGLTSGMVNAPS